MRPRARRGNSMLEFTLVGIPMIFVLISIFEISRMMWAYHTLSAAVTEGARFAIVHGKSCGQAPNDCAVSIGAVAGRVRARAAGLVPTDTDVSLTSAAGTFTCRLDQCLANTTIWPPSAAGAAGMPIEIAATYSIRSMITMFWPGTASVAPLGQLRFSASSREAIQF